MRPIRERPEHFSKSIQRNAREYRVFDNIIIGHSFYLICWLLKEQFCCSTCRVQYQALGSNVKSKLSCHLGFAACVLGWIVR